MVSEVRVKYRGMNYRIPVTDDTTLAELRSSIREACAIGNDLSMVLIASDRHSDFVLRNDDDLEIAWSHVNPGTPMFLLVQTENTAGTIACI